MAVAGGLEIPVHLVVNEFANLIFMEQVGRWQRWSDEAVERLIGELVALAGPAYFFLQLLTAIRYRGLWRLAALVPLVVMLPLAAHAALAFAAGAPGRPMLLILISPLAFLYLLAVAIGKGAAGSFITHKGR